MLRINRKSQLILRQVLREHTKNEAIMEVDEGKIINNSLIMRLALQKVSCKFWAVAVTFRLYELVNSVNACLFSRKVIILIRITECGGCFHVPWSLRGLSDVHVLSGKC